MSNDWKKVTKTAPCIVCKKPDWCAVGLKFANCMRIESSTLCRNGGWLHALDSAPVKLPLREKKPEPMTINCTRIMAQWRDNTLREWVHDLAFDLSVEPSALYSLGVAWAADRKAWAFPMYDGYGNTIGIRLRTGDGKKFAVTGSRQGIFVSSHAPSPEIFITEGPTDCAALLSIGIYAIGRPSCLGCEDMIRDFVREKRIKRAVIVADADEPGQRGAEKLQPVLRVQSKIWTPPAKDIRAAVIAGIDAKTIGALTKEILWNNC